MRNYPSVSIIFPTHNGWEDTRKCLLSINKLGYPKAKIKIIVIDNSSTDGTVLFIRKNFPKVALIVNKVNLGFARAINQGAQKSRSELILVTNNDVVFTKKCLKELIKTFTTYQKVAAVGGKILANNQKKLLIAGFRLNPYLAYHQYDLSGSNHERECDFISGNCLLIPRKLLLKLGGFDEKYFFYFEDVDFCLQAKKAGFKLLYCPRSVVYHGHGNTILKETHKNIFLFTYRSRWRCIFKNGTPLQILTSSLFLLLLTPLYQSILTGQNVYSQMLRGLLDNFGLLFGKNEELRG